jgi:hypothetical protein
MKTTKYALAAVLGLIALMVPSAARADDIILVTISDTYNNTPASGINCSSPCSETENATFEWDNTTNICEWVAYG